MSHKLIIKYFALILMGSGLSSCTGSSTTPQTLNDLSKRVIKTLIDNDINSHMNLYAIPEDMDYLTEQKYKYIDRKYANRPEARARWRRKRKNRAEKWKSLRHKFNEKAKVAFSKTRSTLIKNNFDLNNMQAEPMPFTRIKYMYEKYKLEFGTHKILLRSNKQQTTLAISRVLKTNRGWVITSNIILEK